MSRSLLLLLVVLAATPAAAAPAEDDGYETEEKPRDELEGTSRFSLMTGWRYAPNGRFFDMYYLDPDNRGLKRSRGAMGGPLLTGSFAYSPINWFEVGLDLFATYERMALTGKPGLNAVTYGALFGLRFQHKFDIGSHGLVPSAGFLIGPMLVASYFDGGKALENFTQSIGVTAGATWYLSEAWGLRFEYRLLTGRGDVEDVGSYEGAGSWFSVGFNYQFPPKPDRPMGRMY
ncbi:hypothetical protein [Hyalangium minutum]|uniref:Outer membrane protein beta-barrel domain-containing protein n=1 Tax=Hyalangium minutum TaxID=394096 RepID=A0A085WEQ3_9BACT|nr:hypothetical protein [Hyalangium minutum]KFE66166.1 hypothetical protein DB31_1231 [Hyalangium minutum]